MKGWPKRPLGIVRLAGCNSIRYTGSMRLTLVTLALAGLAIAARAQDPGSSGSNVPDAQKRGGNAKMKLLSRTEVNPGSWKAADIEIEQDKNRPYVYVCGFVNNNTKIYDISNTSAPKLIYTWTIENPAAPRHRRDGREVLQDQ